LLVDALMVRSSGAIGSRASALRIGFQLIAVEPDDVMSVCKRSAIGLSHLARAFKDLTRFPINRDPISISFEENCVSKSADL
jgi:hypothetical protein